jgi:hypothetical protein
MEKPVIFVFGVKRVFLSNNLHQVCLIFQALCLSEGFLVNYLDENKKYAFIPSFLHK